jgi:hypothetical protein
MRLGDIAASPGITDRRTPARSFQARWAPTTPWRLLASVIRLLTSLVAPDSVQRCLLDLDEQPDR